MQWIDILARHQGEWVNIVKSFGAGDFAEDIVQEMYLRIDKAQSGDKAIINDQPNRAFVWVVLKNIYVSQMIKSNKVQMIDIEDIRHIVADDYSIIKHQSIAKIDRDIMNLIDSWNTYDRELFKLHVLRHKSMRDISSGTNISLKSIWNTIKNCKKKLQNEVGEDYMDYLNEDYERI